MLHSLKNTQNFPINFPMNFSGKLTAKIVIKDDYVRADGTSALYLQIFLNKEKKKVPCNIAVKTSEFDKVKQRVKSKHILHKDYNLIIEKMLSDINKIEVNYRLSGTVLTLTRLLEEFENPTSRIDFIKFWENEMERQKEILKPDTYRQQITMLNKTKNFKSPLFFYEITENYIQDLKTHCKNNLKNTDNTISSLLKSFKKYLHIANKKGITTPVSFDDIKNKTFKGNRTFLSPEEIIKINNYWESEFIKESHKNILSRFLFSCFTGLRISDIDNLKEENIISDTLVFTAVKTGKFQRVNLNDSAKKYIDKKIIFKSGYTGEYINRELKDIAKICGIRKTISYHVSRHTFATNFLLCGGRVEQLQKILGHSKITDTMIYVHIVDSITDIQINNMDDILLKKQGN
jgi:site-specific recombinase XerD